MGDSDGSQSLDSRDDGRHLTRSFVFTASCWLEAVGHSRVVVIFLIYLGVCQAGFFEPLLRLIEVLGTQVTG